MNNLNDEQRKRLREIRESVNRFKPNSIGASLLHGYAIELLTLIDSKAELARELAMIVDVGTCDDPGTALNKVRRLRNAAASAMRDKCVEAVVDYFGGLTSTQVNRDELVAVLKSLTLEEKQQS